MHAEQQTPTRSKSYHLQLPSRWSAIHRADRAALAHSERKAGVSSSATYFCFSCWPRIVAPCARSKELRALHSRRLLLSPKNRILISPRLDRSAQSGWRECESQQNVPILPQVLEWRATVRTRVP